MSARPAAMPAAARDAREELSCLLDGELPADERACLERLCADRALQGDWALWHAVGDALRSSEVAAMHSADFSTRVGRALEAEPAILAPRPLPGRRMMRRVVLPGAAAAAAAVMLTVVALPMLRGTPEPGRVELAGAARNAAVPVAAPAQPAAAPPTQVVRVDRSPELEAYLQAHRQMSGGMGMPRTAQYFRHASATSPER